MPFQAGCDGAAVQAEERTRSVNAACQQLFPTGEAGPLLFRHAQLAVGNSSAAESPASVTFSTLSSKYSQPLRVHALLCGELCTLPHICAALVYDFGWESHVQTTHCVASPPQLHACCVYVSYTDAC